ncbi:tRNA-ribosyltransferase, partial [Halobacteriales archaeon QH_10_67_13]
MTEYFEVRDRDGPARLGQLRLATPVTTPAILDEDRIEDAGSLWVRDRELPEGGEDVLTVLPHRGVPGGTPTEVQEAFAVEQPKVSYPSAAVIGAETAERHGTDAYVLSDARSAVGHAEAFVDALCRVREAIPADTALYLPGVATPGNVGLLAYAGVDLVDSHRAVLKGLEGKYLTADGERVLEDLEEQPCACPACRGDAFDLEACAEHNEYALETALATVRERIRAGQLRDYLEGQIRHERWLTAAVRRFDEQYGYLEERTPVCRQAEITATNEDALRRVEIRRYADRVTTRYRPRFEGPPVLVPCSATKPDSESPSHAQFHDAIGYRAHKLSMTSPIGVVPQELEWTYPAQHYDAVVTGRWTETELEFVADVLARYLDGAGAYGRIVAHVPETGYREVVERALARAQATP